MKRDDNNSTQNMSSGGGRATSRRQTRTSIQSEVVSRSSWKIFLLIGVLIGIILFVYAAPNIDFVNPTPPDNNVTLNNWVYVNVSISGGNTSFIDWNNSLVGWWRMNNETGENSTFVKDWSTWGNNGTVTGATYNATGGKFGGGFEFDGDGDYIGFGNIEGLNNFTLSLWFKSQNLSDNDVLFYSGSSDFLLGFYSNKLRLRYDGIWNNFLGDAVEDGNWHYVVFIQNQTKARVLLDGTQVKEVNSIPLIFNNVFLGNYFNGTIDEVVLFNRALSQIEIMELYNSTSNLYHNFTNLVDGNYSIRAYSQNSSGDVNSTERYVTVYTKPAITLNSPSDSFVTSNTSLNFNCSALINNEIYSLLNATLYTNYSGNWESNGTNSFIGTSNSTIFTRTFPEADKNFVWNCYACDNESRCGFGSNRTITIDVTFPSISFTDDTPANNSVLNYDWIFINSSINDTSRTSSFIDFNRSLKLWLRFNMRDYSTYGNNGTVTNATYTENGKFGGAFEFDGNSDYYVTIEQGNSLNITNEITMSAWVKLPDATDYSMILIKLDSLGGAAHSPYMLGFYQSKVYGWLENSTGRIAFGGGSKTLTNNEWHHLLITWNGTHATKYLDGQSDGIYSISGSLLTGSGKLRIAEKGNNLFNGTIDEVMIFNRGISSEEVSALYNAQRNNFYHNFTNLDDGVYNFTLYAQDIVGHISSEYREVEVWDDPRITLNYPLFNNTNIILSPLLNITVSNYEGNDMDVSFYNASSGEIICNNNSISNGSSVLCRWENLAELQWHKLGINVTDGITTTVLNNSFYVGPFVEIKEFYDDRQMGVIFTGDDWESSRHTDFLQACDASQATGVVFSPGLNPGGRWPLNISFNSSQWEDIQEQIDEGWIVPTSHSTHHLHEENITLEDAEGEIQGSWDAIVGNLTLPFTLTFNGTEYLLGFITPYYIWNDNVTYWFNQTGFLVSRGNNGVDPSPQGWGIWNDTWNFYGVRRTLDIIDGGSLEFRKNSFDTSYVNRVVWHLMTHPFGLNWSEGSENWQLLEYVGNRTDVWYAGLGEMFAYHVVENRSLSNTTILSSVDDTSKIEIKANISSWARNKWGLSYPMTYEVSIPNDWTDVTVYYKNTSDGTYTQMTEKDRTTVWNGIDAYRKNMSEDRVYVSKAFPQTSNEVYLAIHPPDITAPSISFSLSSDSVNVGDTITASCTATDTIDDNPTITYTANPSTSSAGTYTSTCTATDYAGNTVTSSLEYVVLSSSSSSIFSPSSSQLKEGYSKLLRKNQKVQMSINEQTHTAVVKSVNNTDKKVEIELEEINKTFELNENETQKIDLDNDRYYDLQISVKGFGALGYAELEFKEIYEEIPASEQEGQESPSKTEFEIKNWMWVVGGLIGLVVVGLVIRRLFRSRNK